MSPISQRYIVKTRGFHPSGGALVAYRGCRQWRARVRLKYRLQILTRRLNILIVGVTAFLFVVYSHDLPQVRILIPSKLLLNKLSPDPTLAPTLVCFPRSRRSSGTISVCAYSPTAAFMRAPRTYSRTAPTIRAPTMKSILHVRHDQSALI